jgi:hypothetical protein
VSFVNEAPEAFTFLNFKNCSSKVQTNFSLNSEMKKLFYYQTVFEPISSGLLTPIQHFVHTIKLQLVLNGLVFFQKIEPSAIEDFFGLTTDIQKSSETGYILFYQSRDSAS